MAVWLISEAHSIVLRVVTVLNILKTLRALIARAFAALETPEASL